MIVFFYQDFQRKNLVITHNLLEAEKTNAVIRA